MGAEILIVAIVAVFFVYLYFVSDIIKYFVYAVLSVFGLVLFFRYFVKKYDEYERGIIFRMGRYNRIGGPGWTMIIPFFEKEFARLDVRTKMTNLHVQSAFTKEDLQLGISGFIYYKVVNPSKAILEIDNYRLGLMNLINSETRNVIGSMFMRDVFRSLDKLNDLLADKIRHQTWKWGVDVSMVQVQNIRPAEDIIVAMKQKTIAKEMLQAQTFRAEAKKVTIEAVGEAAKSLDERALTYIYIKALEKISQGKATKIFFPAKLMNVVESFGKGIGASVAGVNLDEAIEAVKNKILEG